MLTFEDVSFEL